MEFWGVEVKPGEPLIVTPELGQIIRISQAALGEVENSKGAADSVPLRLKIDNEKFVLGTLSVDGTPQLPFDLVFERKFELSHGWKSGSVYFCGCTADNPVAESDSDEFSLDEFSTDEDEDHSLDTIDNGKLEREPNFGKAKHPETKATPVKPESSTKPKVTLVEPKKAEDSDKDSSASEDSDVPMNHSVYSGSSEDVVEGDESDDDESDEETPKKAELDKKRPSASGVKTPVPAKKAKFDTPQKTDGKKGGGHTATPHPGKKANINKSKEQAPKSSGQVSCKSCSKTFNSETALQSHAKAKHGGK